MEYMKLRARFTELGLTQAEVAEKIGISANSLSRKLNGRQDFKLSEVRSLCNVLGIDNQTEIFLR